MVRVDDLQAGVDFYARAFGFRLSWRDDVSAGMAMPETDAEVVLYTIDLPAGVSVHYLVDDVPDAVADYVRSGGIVRVAPFDIRIGKCAVLEDPFGNAVCVLDASTGPRPG